MRWPVPGPVTGRVFPQFPVSGNTSWRSMGRSLWKRSGKGEWERCTQPFEISIGVKNPHYPLILRRDRNRSATKGICRPFLLKKPPEICVKKSDQQKPAKLQDQIAFKSVIFGEITHLNRYFFSGGHHLPKNPKTGSGKWQSEPEMGSRIDHLLEQGNCPESGFV